MNMAFLEEIAKEIVRERFGNDVSMLQICLKCLLHDQILNGLLQSGMLDHSVFHGGTCVQKVFGGARLSEDLDFDYIGEDIEEFMDLGGAFTESVTSLLVSQFGIPRDRIEIVVPKGSSLDAKGSVATWVVKVAVDVRSKSYAPKSRVKVEFSNTPCFNAETRIVKPFDEKSRANPFMINVVSLPEMFVDKATALIGRKRLKFRDVYDAAFMAWNSVPFDEGLFLKKLAFHRPTAEDYLRNIRERVKELKSEDAREKYLQEMRRFLPASEIALIEERGLDRAALSNAMEMMEQKGRLIASENRKAKAPAVKPK